MDIHLDRSLENRCAQGDHADAEEERSVLTPSIMPCHAPARARARCHKCEEGYPVSPSASPPSPSSSFSPFALPPFLWAILTTCTCASLFLLSPLAISMYSQVLCCVTTMICLLYEKGSGWT